MDKEINDRYTVTEKFYNRNPYKDYEKDLFFGTRAVWNPVVKTINIMKGLTLQKNINIKANKDTEAESISILKKIWEDNSFSSIMSKLVKSILLSQHGIISLYKQKDSNMIDIVLQDIRGVDIKENDEKVYYAELTGEIETFDMTTKEFQKTKVVQEWHDVQGYRNFKETIGEKIESDIPLAFEFIPIVHFKSDYDIMGMIEAVDEYNEIEAFMRAIFEIHGDPIVIGEGTSALDKTSKERLKTSKYKDMRLLHIPEGTLKYLEMSGDMVDKMQKKQEMLVSTVEKEYPEYVLASVLQGANQSGDALAYKMTEIISAINDLRKELNTKLVLMNNYILQMLGRTPLEHSIQFDDVVIEGLNDKIARIKELRAMNILSPVSAMKLIPEIIPNAEDELKLIEKSQPAATSLFGTGNGHADS